MPAETTVFSVRMDASIKDSLDDFCAEVGMNTNTAINMFARVVAREKCLPFDVAIDPFNNERNTQHEHKAKTSEDFGVSEQSEQEVVEAND